MKERIANNVPRIAALSLAMSFYCAQADAATVDTEDLTAQGAVSQRSALETLEQLLAGGPSIEDITVQGFALQRPALEALK